MKRAIFSVFALLLAASVSATPGDANITFTVPLSLQKLDPLVKMVGTYCEIKDGGGTVIATGFGQISTIVTGGAISGNSVTPAMVPAAKVTSAKSWNCSLMLETANGNCITGAAGANTLPWCAFDASSKTTVNGSF